MTVAPHVTRETLGNAVAGELLPDLFPHALTVYDPATGDVGHVTGLTSELRPIVSWNDGRVRSRCWDELAFSRGRAW